MVVRAVINKSIVRQISQCTTELDFKPLAVWPKVLPSIAWNGSLLVGFDRESSDVTGDVIDLGEQAPSNWIESFKACHPQLGLGELGRLVNCLKKSSLPTDYEHLFAQYGLRWCDRLSQTLKLLETTPLDFQNWVDQKSVGTRDLSPLLALENTESITEFLSLVPKLNWSKSQATQALEWYVELFLLGHNPETLNPESDDGSAYGLKLAKLRRPMAALIDAEWKEVVSQWAWPNQVQGNWQRFGDQCGLEIKIRTTSPQDLTKKLERLSAIQQTWAERI